MRLIFSAALLFTCAASGQTVSTQTAASTRLPRSWTVSLQTGLAGTFQLTLGGMFGEGPAWQSKGTLSLNNALVNGDSVSFFGWKTFDAPTANVNHQFGVSYRAVVYRKRGQSLSLGGGVQRWVFPHVLTGTRDWLVAGNLHYQTKVWKAPFSVTSDSWSLLHSNLPKGSLVNTQVHNVQPLFRNDSWQVSLKHGPHHTYSWGFYGTQGHRVIRYAAGVVVSHRATVLEAGYRKQWGLKSYIPDNNFWSFCLTHSFNF